MSFGTITRTFRIALGHSARFSYEPDAGLLVELFPSCPHLRSIAARHRFLAVYNGAKQAFLAAVEAETGASLDGVAACGDPEWPRSPAERESLTKEERRSPSTSKNGHRVSVEAGTSGVREQPRRGGVF
jgi:hypothetical protein